MKLSPLIGIILLSIPVLASSKISLKILEIHNLAKSEAMEVCGIATHADGKKPLLVTLTHEQSNYTILTSENGKWCNVIKRWSFSGTVEAVASTLDYSEKSNPTQY